MTYFRKIVFDRSNSKLISTCERYVEIFLLGQLQEAFVSNLPFEELTIKEKLKWLRGRRDDSEFGVMMRKTADEALAEMETLRKWINDLHSGMFINCVYCGHRYGPNDEVPDSMADVLKEHVEQCPKHPMSKLKRIMKHQMCRAWGSGYRRGKLDKSDDQNEDVEWMLEDVENLIADPPEPESLNVEHEFEGNGAD